MEEQCQSSDPQWEVGGLIVGPLLPNSLVFIGDVAVAPRSDPLMTNVTAHRRPSDLRVKLKVPGVQWSPPYYAVNSEHAVRVVLNAVDEGQATLLGTRRIQDACTSLALATGAVSYDFELCDTNPLNGPAGATPFSQAAWFRQWQPQDMCEDVADLAARISRSMYENRVVRKCVSAMEDANSLAAISSVAPVSAEILLCLFRVVEAITDRVTEEWRKSHKNEILDSQRPIVEALFKQLQQSYGEDTDFETSETVRRVSYIEMAATSIRQAREDVQSAEIQRASQLLDVVKEDMSIALRMNRLRKRVAHPGEADQRWGRVFIFGFLLRFVLECLYGTSIADSVRRSCLSRHLARQCARGDLFHAIRS